MKKVFITKYVVSAKVIQVAEGEESKDVPGAFRGKIEEVGKYNKEQLFKKGEWFENLGDAVVDANHKAIRAASMLEQRAAGYRALNFVTTNMVG